MPSDIFAPHVRRDYRAEFRKLVVDVEPYKGERLRLVMGEPAARISRNMFVYHAGELVTVSGHRCWAVIEQDQENGEHISIGACLPVPGIDRPALIYPQDPEFVYFAEATPGFRWLPLAYRYLEPPQKRDPDIQDGTGWSATWKDMQVRCVRC